MPASAALTTFGGLLVTKAPNAAPTMISTSVGCHSSNRLPPPRIKPIPTLNRTTTEPMITNIMETSSSSDKEGREHNCYRRNCASLEWLENGLTSQKWPVTRGATGARQILDFICECSVCTRQLRQPRATAASGCEPCTARALPGNGGAVHIEYELS